jgi:aminopeptidase N
MGADSFEQCLSEFFESYQFRRAGVEEFKLIAQKYTADDLQPFFDQWLNDWEIPEVRWKDRTEDNQLRIEFRQNQKNVYQLRIPIVAKGKNGQIVRLLASVEKREDEFIATLPFEPDSISVDPLHETLIKMNRSKN